MRLPRTAKAVKNGTKSVGETGPCGDWDDIAPNDSNDIGPYRAFKATGAGTVKVRTLAGNDRTVTLLAGETFPGGIDRVYQNGTSATGLIGFI